MKYQELLILLPCHSLEDFPTHLEGDEAHGLLSSWSALWHPALIAAAGQAPGWRRVDEPPTEVRERLIVAPAVSASRLPTGFGQRVKDEGGVLIRKTEGRAEIVAAALAPLSDSAGPDVPLAADFLALGYCYLQVELLTRQMRYASNLDEAYFKSTVVTAAQAAVGGQTDLAREKLSACFSLLAEERDHYYPVDAFIVDLNLTAETTLGAALREELQSAAPTNVLLSGEMLERLAAQEPATLASLKESLAAGRVSIIGGEYEEDRSSLLTPEQVLANLRRGLTAYDRLLAHRPQVFGRRRFGLVPTMPGILHKLGFQGALHVALEEGKVPHGLQLKTRWEGLDGSAIDAIAKSPLDASQPQTFLALATKLGESMDTDHVATLCLAHWPREASPWIEDLRLISRYCSALGKWVTVDEYFSKTDHPGQLERFEATRYRSPYLKQAIIRRQENPISSVVDAWQSQAQRDAAAALDALSALVTGKPSEAASADSAAAAPRFADAISGGAKGPRGTLVVNPGSLVRRFGIAGLPLAAPPVIERPVYAAERRGDGLDAVVDVPAFGFVHLTEGKQAPSAGKSPLIAENGLLRNEFFEAVINPKTGSLAALHEFKSRGNRLSQQLALRSPAPRQKPGDTHRDEGEAAVYTTMAADSIETTIATSALGEIVSRGRLLDQSGNAVAHFAQTYRLWRGSRVLHLEIEITPQELPKADPWNSYYCVRFAWADEMAEVFRAVNGSRQAVAEKRFEAPQYVEVASDKQSTTILTGGLPFHQRAGDTGLESILITKGESRTRFRLGIGVDLAHPLPEAQGLLLAPLVVPGVPAPASGAAGWLLHLSARNVIATHLEPLSDGGRIAGLRARLLETAGRPANVSLSAFRAISAGESVDFLGNRIAELAVADGKLKVDLSAHEWLEVIARW